MDKPFSTSFSSNGSILLRQNYSLQFIGGKILEFSSYLVSGWGIVKNSVLQEQKFLGHEKDIIAGIHRERFNPQNWYVITGAHFHQLYVRNLGIFYNALLDSRIPSTKEDWNNRQRITLQTLALDLEIFRLAKKTYTTIVSLKRHIYTAMNVRTAPSDVLFSILYSFCALIYPNFIETMFPVQKKTNKHKLQTIKSAKELLIKYSKDLNFLINEYKESVLDNDMGIIKKNIHLASAMDGLKRTSSFYDNVIVWATCKLASKLNIILISEKDLLAWKTKIIEYFWDETEGIFLDDLSEFSKKTKLFATDALIVTSTQFLDIKMESERNMLERIVAYIKNQAMDKPFPVLFTTVNQKNRMYTLIKLFTPEYMGNGIWSHWGIEYIKLLIMLGKYNPLYLPEAKKHLNAYKQAIENYGGYPELYNRKGEIYKNRAYKAVLKNGWIINYEQAKLLLRKA